MFAYIAIKPGLAVVDVKAEDVFVCVVKLFATVPLGKPTQLFIVLDTPHPNVPVCGHVNVNLLVISLYVTVIPKKLLTPFANTAFNAVKNVVTV